MSYFSISQSQAMYLNMLSGYPHHKNEPGEWINIYHLMDRDLVYEKPSGYHITFKGLWCLFIFYKTTIKY